MWLLLECANDEQLIRARLQGHRHDHISEPSAVIRTDGVRSGCGEGGHHSSIRGEVTTRGDVRGDVRGDGRCGQLLYGDLCARRDAGVIPMNEPGRRRGEGGGEVSRHSFHQPPQSPWLISLSPIHPVAIHRVSTPLTTPHELSSAPHALSSDSASFIHTRVLTAEWSYSPHARSSGSGSSTQSKPYLCWMRRSSHASQPPMTSSKGRQRYTIRGDGLHDKGRRRYT